VPDGSILYCSEACRRIDTAKPSPIARPLQPVTSSPPPLRDIVAPASPTAPQYPRPLRSLSGGELPPQIPLPLSHSQASSPTEQNPPTPTVHSPLASHESRHLSYQFPLTGPSLVNTSTTPSSPLNRSFSSSSSLYSYVTSTRPLPPRHNPAYSASSCSPRSVDLVTPYTTSHTTAPSGDDTPTPVTSSLTAAVKQATAAGLPRGAVGPTVVYQQAFTLEDPPLPPPFATAGQQLRSKPATGVAGGRRAEPGKAAGALRALFNGRLAER
jgi:hypothetical protein